MMRAKEEVVVVVVAIAVMTVEEMKGRVGMIDYVKIDEIVRMMIDHVEIMVALEREEGAGGRFFPD